MPRNTNKLNKEEARGKKRKIEEVTFKSNKKADENKHKVKSSVVKKLNFEENKTRKSRTTAKQIVIENSEAGHNSGYAKGKSPEENLTKTLAKFVEEGDEVLFKVEGQATEFATDNEGIEQTESSESEDDMEEGELDLDESRNNNANVSRFNRNEPMTSKDSDEVERCQANQGQMGSNNVNKSTEGQNIGKEEEEGMQRFVDYINKKGLVIVNADVIRNLGESSGTGMNDKTEESKKSNKTTVDMTSRTENKHAKSSGECENESVVTVYKNAVSKAHINESDNLVQDKKGSDPRNFNRYSSSSEEGPLDSSDKIVTLTMDKLTIPNNEQGTNQIIGQFISDAHQRMTPQSVVNKRSYTGPQIDGYNHGTASTGTVMHQLTHVQGMEQMVQDAEMSKARIYDVKGNNLGQGLTAGKDLNIVFHSSLLDEDYLLVGSYVDEMTKQKIGNREYIDFSKLMPKDQMSIEEDHWMEMVNKGGMSYWLPVADREATVISSYRKWEQAFRVFSNIYTEFHPHRAGELIQYNHIIHTTSQSYVWENVYRYDREFRLHMAKHHQHRSWGVILQQAWSMFLKDRVNYRQKSGNNYQSGNNHNPTRRRLCFNFNAGNCTFSRRCRFDHRCSYCNKFGHGAFNCRRAGNRTSNGNGQKRERQDHTVSNVHRNGNSDGNRWDRYEKNQINNNNNNNNKKS